MKREKLLLHTCCAPCMTYPYFELKKQYDITVFFFNPNIMPAAEYLKRLEEIKKFSRTVRFELILEEENPRQWVSAVKEYKFLGEKSERCRVCYRYRLEKTFRTAINGGFDIVCTTLSISPHKNAIMINQEGSELAGKYGINFLSVDFKKNGGFKKSSELSKEYGFYRQNYCGCVYSRLERIKGSPWSEKVLAEKEKNSMSGSDDFFPETGDEIDLHHFHPADTRKVVEYYLAKALENNYRKVRIIHGKGKSVKKREVHNILKSHPGVVSFHDDSWNWGSTLVHLTF